MEQQILLIQSVHCKRDIPVRNEYGIEIDIVVIAFIVATVEAIDLSY